jgi:hypothetical protein
MTIATLEVPLRREALRDTVLATVDLLHLRRAGGVREGYIDS